MKYSIVIPTYNHCNDLLKPCVESIFKYTNVSDIELIISANGCKDETFAYLGALKEKFVYLGLEDNLKITWAHEPLGYSRATNEGIKLATTDLIVLLNNDTVLLTQSKNAWLEILAAQFQHPNCGISCLIKGESAPAGFDFAVFFCVMIHRKVFDKIGLLNTDYGVGGGEDTEFSIECERAGFEVREAVVKTWSHEANMYVGAFPIYHKGEGTVHDVNLVPEWNRIFRENSIRLAKKYNPSWYQWAISNDSERGVFFKGDSVFPREKARYEFAAKNMIGSKVLEIGCSSGFGFQFLPQNIEYTGVDNSQEIIDAANEQAWGDNAKFVCQDIHKFPLDYYDTIIAYESIEHIPDGLQLVEKLKDYCNQLIITVPYNENPGQFSPHHLTHNLTIGKFKGFNEIGLLDIDGNFVKHEQLVYGNEYNLLITWEKPVEHCRNKNHIDAFNYLIEQHNEIYGEVVTGNCYNVSYSLLANRPVIDIGANIGAFSLLAAHHGASKVLAVEPVGQTYNHLLNNITQSGLSSIVPIQKIITDVDGQTFKMSINENSGHNSMYNVAENYEEVVTTTLQSLLDQVEGNDIFLKLDCEGAEYDILLNATNEQMSRVTDIVVEIHAELHPKYKGFQLIFDKLTEFKFKRIDEKQIYVWYYDQNGNVTNVTPIPYKIEIWRK